MWAVSPREASGPWSPLDTWRAALTSRTRRTALGPVGLLGREGEQGLPRLDRSDQRGGLVQSQRDPEEPRAPQVARGFVAALGLERVADLRRLRDVEGESRVAADQGHPQRRDVAAARDLVAVGPGSKTVRSGVGQAHQGVVRAEVHERPQDELDGTLRTKGRPPRTVPLDESVGEVDRVLEVGQEEPLLQGDSADLVAPDWEPGLEVELGKAAADVGDRPADERLDADRGERAVGQAEALVEPVEHHHPAERSG